MNASTALRTEIPANTNVLVVQRPANIRPINRDRQPQPTEKQGLIRRLAALVVANIKDENYGIKQLCQDAGMSRSSLHGHLKAITRLSASKFIRAIRLQRAQLLLIHTELNITEVAYEVGFGDPRYFSRVFSLEFKQSPRDFRRKKHN